MFMAHVDAHWVWYPLVLCVWVVHLAMAPTVRLK
jgi:hypothetical protein